MRLGFTKQTTLHRRFATRPAAWAAVTLVTRWIGWTSRPIRHSSRKFARSQRQNMTRAETMLWRAVRNRRIDGYGFRKQTPVGPYFADFVCLGRKIVVDPRTAILTAIRGD